MCGATARQPGPLGPIRWVLGCSTLSGGGPWLFRACLGALEPPSACASRPFASCQHPGRRVAELVGASRLVTLAETGHLPMDERPEELAALLLEWVLGSEQPPPPSTVSK